MVQLESRQEVLYKYYPQKDNPKLKKTGRFEDISVSVEEKRSELVRATEMPLFGIEGVEFVESKESRNFKRKSVERCLGFVFQDVEESSDCIDRVKKILEEESPIKKTPGCLAIYFDKDGNFRHIGKVAQNGLVISKWGELDVYMHKPELVPPQYGAHIIYFPDIFAKDI